MSTETADLARLETDPAYRAGYLAGGLALGELGAAAVAEARSADAVRVRRAMVNVSEAKAAYRDAGKELERRTAELFAVLGIEDISLVVE